MLKSSSKPSQKIKERDDQHKMAEKSQHKSNLKTIKRDCSKRTPSGQE